MSDKTEYALRYYSDSPVVIEHEWTDDHDRTWVAVRPMDDDYPEMTVRFKSDLVLWSNTARAKNKERLQQEIDELTAKREELVKSMQDDAIKSLVARIRLNVAFGKATGGEQVVMVIVEQLTKLIEEKESVKL